MNFWQGNVNRIDLVRLMGHDNRCTKRKFYFGDQVTKYLNGESLERISTLARSPPKRRTSRLVHIPCCFMELNHLAGLLYFGINHIFWDIAQMTGRSNFAEQLVML